MVPLGGVEAGGVVAIEEVVKVESARVQDWKAMMRVE